MPPGKIVFGVVPSKNGNRCPSKSGLSSLYYCVLCLTLCRARCLSFWLKFNRMATLLGKSQSFCSLCVLSEKCFVVFNLFSLTPGVYVGTLNLIASIPGPSVLTLSDNKNGNYDPLRAVSKLKRKEMGHTMVSATEESFV